MRHKDFLTSFLLPFVQPLAYLIPSILLFHALLPVSLSLLLHQATTPFTQSGSTGESFQTTYQEVCPCPSLQSFQTSSEWDCSSVVSIFKNHILNSSVSKSSFGFWFFHQLVMRDSQYDHSEMRDWSQYAVVKFMGVWPTCLCCLFFASPSYAWSSCLSLDNCCGA